MSCTQHAPATCSAPGPLDRSAMLLALGPKLSRYALLVGLAMLQHAGTTDGRAWPSTVRLAQLVGFDASRVRAAKRELRAAGFLREVVSSSPRRTATVVVAPAARRGDLHDVLAVRARLDGREPLPQQHVARRAPVCPPAANETGTRLPVEHATKDEHAPPTAGVASLQKVAPAAEPRTGPRLRLEPVHLLDPTRLHRVAAACGELPDSEHGRDLARAICARVRSPGTRDRLAVAAWLLRHPDRLRPTDFAAAAELWPSAPPPQPGRGSCLGVGSILDRLLAAVKPAPAAGTAPPCHDRTDPGRTEPPPRSSILRGPVAPSPN